jgi:hypothetical protein
MLKATLVTSALVLWSAGATSAQAPTSTLEGTVVDSSGGVVVGATAIVVNTDTNQSRSLTTDGAGVFRFAQLPVGTYSIQVTYSGFSDFTQSGVVIAIGQTVSLTITLTPSGVAETVGVTARSPSPLDARQTAVTTTVDNDRIEELPVQSRDYLHFVLLAPGVVSSPSGAPSSTASTLPDSGFSFAGLRPRSNMLSIDGLDNNDRYSGASRTELSLEVVREFQVVSNGWSAANGGASGGAINVVTKSGTNTFHGDAFVFGESGRLNAQPPLEETAGSKPDLTRFRGGVSVGGPVVKDRTFFYAAVEWEQTDGQAASDIDPQVVSTINARLAQDPYPQLGTRLTAGLFPTALTETEWSAKLNHQFTPRHSAMVRLAGTTRDETANAFNTGGLTDVSARGSSSTGDTTLTATSTSVLGSRMTNDVRGQVARRRVDLSTTDVGGPGVLIAGVAEFGRPYAGNDGHDQRYAELGDTLGWSRGPHFVSTGFDLINVRLTGQRTDGMGGLFQFRTLDEFLAARPDAFRQVFGASAVDMASTHLGVFLQDHWTPVSRLTLDAGARVDLERLPTRLDVSDTQVSPRVGVAWAPAAKWVVRGGIGSFADRLVLAAFEPAMLVDGRQGFEQVVNDSAASPVVSLQPGSPLRGGLTGVRTLANPRPDVAPSIYSVQPGTWHSSSRQASVGIERELTPNLTASLNYLFARGRQLPRTVNVNLPPPTVLTLANAPSLGVDAPVPQQLGRPVFGTARLNPVFDAMFQVQPSAASTYHGVTMMLNRRLANELEWTAAYTWSRATDTASDFDEQPENPYDSGAESADSRYDQRHRFVASALFDLPIGEDEDRQPGELPGLWTRVFSNIEVGPILTLDSGRPSNALTGADDARTQAFPPTARPLGMARNSLRLPASATVDLRVLKVFHVQPHGKLDIVIEVFNLLNRLNVTQLNGIYGPLATPTPAFGQPIDAAAARRMQFSLDFEF